MPNLLSNWTPDPTTPLDRVSPSLRQRTGRPSFTVCVARPPFRLRSMSRSQRARGWRPPPAPVFGFPRQPQFWLGVLVGLAFSAAILVTHFTGRHSGRVTLWGANTAGVAGRVATMGLPPAFGTKVHIHQHLDLFVDGKRVVV